MCPVGWGTDASRNEESSWIWSGHTNVWREGGQFIVVRGGGICPCVSCPLLYSFIVRLFVCFFVTAVEKNEDHKDFSSCFS